MKASAMVGSTTFFSASTMLKTGAKSSTLQSMLKTGTKSSLKVSLKAVSNISSIFRDTEDDELSSPEL